jgi:hypothetical protein
MRAAKIQFSNRGGRGRVVHAVIGEEGEDWVDRNERIR